MRRFLALLALIPIAAAAGEPLGRLFFTPAQRTQLDAARAEKSRAPAAAEAEEPQPLPQVITYSGIVRRSDGKTTVWINNRPAEDGRSTESPALASRVHPDGSVVLRLPQNERPVRLRVGQSVDLASGTIEEPWARKPPEVPPPERSSAAGAPASITAPGAVRATRSIPESADEEHGAR